MKIFIDTEKQTLQTIDAQKEETLPLYSNKSFEILSEQWVKVGWNQKFSYTFSWLGRPVIQLPEDLLRIQEVILQIKPDLIIETGIAHGGSLVFYASLCKLLGKGRVIGVDIEIRPHNRTAIEEHFLAPLIHLVEGNSIEEKTIQQVRRLLQPEETSLVVLDSCHEKEHVMAELEGYAPFVSIGSYIIVADGIMQNLGDVPRGKEEWKENNPATAARDFTARHPEFIIEQPPWFFNESTLSNNITYWPNAYIKRIS
ncbi:MAG: CmcI family methyltransferase [Candidatus Ratteibacteria bacterium]|jgi:cephalosporin hydroxylase